MIGNQSTITNLKVDERVSSYKMLQQIRSSLLEQLYEFYTIVGKTNAKRTLDCSVQCNCRIIEKNCKRPEKIKRNTRMCV